MGTNTSTVVGVTKSETITGPVGISPSRNSRINSAAATTNATLAKAGEGKLYQVRGVCNAAADRYLKLYDKATAPTVGTDVPAYTIPLLAGAGFALDWASGLSFSVGIAYALTTGPADNDTGALTLADVVGLNLDFS